MIKYKITYAIKDKKEFIPLEVSGYNTNHAVGRGIGRIRKKFGYAKDRISVVMIKSLGESKPVKVKSYTRVKK
jgi:hypothetical protein